MTDFDRTSTEKTEPFAPSEPHGLPDGPKAVGEPDTLPPTFCRVCQVEVKPIGKGRCPRCQTFLRLNFIARKHPRNVLHRDQLYAENLAEYKPDSLRLRRACRYLANVDERLEHVKDGSPEHVRLLDKWASLTEILDASLSTRTSVADTDLASATTNELIERSTAIARHLIALSDQEQKSEAHIAAATAEHATNPAGPSVQAPVPTSEPAPEQDCPYCHRACVGPDHIAYSALHHDDPIEVKKRDDYATQVMRKQLSQPLPSWYE